MIPENNKKQQDAQLREMNYNPEEDIFNQEEHVQLDANGNPILEDSQNRKQEGDDLDVPGASADDAMEDIGAEDEENNYYSLSDNEDNHEETNDDVL